VDPAAPIIDIVDPRDVAFPPGTAPLGFAIELIEEFRLLNAEESGFVDVLDVDDVAVCVDESAEVN
jgi:hypothetical protein